MTKEEEEKLLKDSIKMYEDAFFEQNGFQMSRNQRRLLERKLRERLNSKKD